jgi:hypothetical protein
VDVGTGALTSRDRLAWFSTQKPGVSTGTWERRDKAKQI